MNRLQEQNQSEYTTNFANSLLTGEMDSAVAFVLIAIEGVIGYMMNMRKYLLISSVLIFAGCATNHFEEGKEAIQQDNYESARSALEQEIQNSPENLNAKKLLGEVYLNLEEYDKARDVFQNVIEKRPDQGKVHAGLAIAEFNLKNYEKSLDHFGQATILGESDGTIQYLTNRINEIETSEDEKMKSHLSSFYMIRGYAKARSGRVEEAISDYNTAIEEDPNNPDLYSGRATLFLTRADFDSAKQDLQKSIKIKKTFRALLGLAEVYLKKGNYEQSLEHVNQSIQVTPNNPNAYMYRAYLYRLMDEVERSNRDVEKFVSLMGRNEDSELYENYFSALLDVVSGRLNVALEQMNKLIDKRPNFSNAYQIRSALHSRLGNRKKSKEDMKKFLSMNQTGVGTSDINRYVEELYKRAKGSAIYDYHQGVEAYHSGNLEKAIEDLTSAIKRDKNYTAAHRTLGNIYYFEKEKYDQAISYYSSAIKSSKKTRQMIDPRLYILRAHAHYSNGNYKKAIEDYNRVIDDTTNRWWVLNGRGSAYIEVGNYEAAERDFRKSNGIKENAQAYVGLARVMFRNELYDNALNFLDRAIDLSPDQPVSYRLKAVIYHRKEIKDKKTENLKKYVNMMAPGLSDKIVNWMARTLDKKWFSN